MLGNILRKQLQYKSTLNRLMKTAEGELMNIVVIFLGVTVGATANGELFLSPGHYNYISGASGICGRYWQCNIW